jgi:serine protease Do
MGVSFAIPIDVARNVEDQLVKTGKVVRGRIGVTIQDVNAQLAESFGLDRPRGALVSSVEKDGPAAKAGLQPGDVILAVNNKPIERYGELSGQIAAMKPGADAMLDVWRGGKRQSVNVKVTELKEQQQQAKLGGKQKDRATNQASQFGLTVRPLDPQEKEQAETQGNLVVEEVTGPAASAGVQPGDIILGVNGKRVKTVKELQDEAKSSGKNVALLIQREDAQIFVPLRIP